MKQIAIIGPTASGKSDLALEVAQKNDAYILSIDSLSIYKEIDIISAKPSKEELQKIKHFGINTLCVDQSCSVENFIQIYQDLVKKCKQENKNLVIVGGTSFYLKSLMSGLSPLPTIDEQVRTDVLKQLQNLQNAYEKLMQIDPQLRSTIKANDRYRIEKMLLIYEATSLSPSQWFKHNPPKAIIESLPIYNIATPRDLLRRRITLRTKKMLELGAIDEVCFLEHKYTRKPQAMGSIGIVEILEYLDGESTYAQMQEKISTHTAQLAKRQQTFNNTQFENMISKPLNELQKTLL